MFTKWIKIIGLLFLAAAMMYASNWDLPKGASKDYTEALRIYEEERNKNYVVIIDGDVYEGAYIDGMWYEPGELYQEVTDYYLEGAE